MRSLRAMPQSVFLDHLLVDIYTAKRFVRICEDYDLKSLADLFAFQGNSIWEKIWYEQLLLIPNFGPTSLEQLIGAIHSYAQSHPEVMTALKVTGFYDPLPNRAREAAVEAFRAIQPQTPKTDITMPRYVIQPVRRSFTN